jgi:hypothetical protein
MHPTLATRVRAALSPASSRSSESLSSRRVDSFQMSPAWQWSLRAAAQNAGQLLFSPPTACMQHRLMRPGSLQVVTFTTERYSPH